MASNRQISISSDIPVVNQVHMTSLFQKFSLDQTDREGIAKPNMITRFVRTSKLFNVRGNDISLIISHCRYQLMDKIWMNSVSIISKKQYCFALRFSK